MVMVTDQFLRRSVAQCNKLSQALVTQARPMQCFNVFHGTMRKI